MPEAEKKKRVIGPDRLTYHHTLAIKAGSRFMNALIEENFPGEMKEEWIKDWVKQAKKKNGVGPIEYLAEKGEMDEAKILAWGARLSGTPIVDTENVSTGNGKHFVIDGMPMTLLTQSEFGMVTLVHCLPFLEEFLDHEVLSDIYGGLRVSFCLSSPTNFYHHLERLHSSGRAQNRILARAEEERKLNFSRQIEHLTAIGLIKEEISKSSKRKEVLSAITQDRPKEGSSGETEWHSLTKGIPYLNLASLASSKELLELMLPSTQKRYSLIPLCEYGGTLTLAGKRGIRGSARQELGSELQRYCKTNIILSSASSINEIINANLSAVISTTSISRGIKLESTPEEEDIEEIDITELAEGSEASVNKLVQSLLIGAVNRKATDIHIAAHPARTWVRYRIDGNMVEAPFHLPFEFWKAVISRIKIMSAIDIKYSPTPQDGKFPLSMSSEEYDIRVNTCPTVYGEKAVLRLQKKEQNIPTLNSLGFFKHEQTLIEGAIEGDHGLIIICGPTGSGKCLGKGTKVMMFSGETRNVENIKNGDLLMGPDSRPRKVKKVNKGKGPLYKVIPEKGNPWVCNDAHILTLKKGNKIKDICIEDFLKKKRPLEWIKDWKLFKVGINFKEESGEITLAGNSYLKGITIGKYGKEPINRTITEQELYGSRDIRLSLLAGLIDKLGKVRGKGVLINIHSTKLIDKIIYLSRSVGFWSTEKRKTKSKKSGRLSYSTTITEISKDLPSLKPKIRNLQKGKSNLEISWKAEGLNSGEYYGFTLDGDGRFLLGDFTVTHNTTTLSAAIYSIDRKRWNVITAENPVEIRIPDVEQTPIDGQQMTFGKFVPAALRQDPDYIMIGETRDRETTEEVIRAAITGHIVMTTLHTNSAAGAPARLIDMGAQPFLITDALKAVCAQRLIRKLCPNCSRPMRKLPSKDELNRMGINSKWLEEADYIMEPVGCKLCNQTGYRGRVAIVEGYFTSPEIRNIIIHHNADSEKIRREIENQGGKTLFQHAVEHVGRHTTSLTEALTVRNLDG
jgi:type II secretory ATPase GspE/PulE/Tfp pilus assembly ATPase PilB-like protein